MNIQLTAETIAISIDLDWKVARQAKTFDAALYRFNAIENILLGMRSLAIFAGDGKDYDEVTETIRLLMNINHEVRKMYCDELPLQNAA